MAQGGPLSSHGSMGIQTWYTLTLLISVLHWLCALVIRLSSIHSMSQAFFPLRFKDPPTHCLLSPSYLFPVFALYILWQILFRLHLLPFLRFTVCELCGNVQGATARHVYRDHFDNKIRILVPLTLSQSRFLISLLVQEAKFLWSAVWHVVELSDIGPHRNAWMSPWCIWRLLIDWSSFR